MKDIEKRIAKEAKREIDEGKARNFIEKANWDNEPPRLKQRGKLALLIGAPALLVAGVLAGVLIYTSRAPLALPYAGYSVEASSNNYSSFPLLLPTDVISFSKTKEKANVIEVSQKGFGSQGFFCFFGSFSSFDITLISESNLCLNLSFSQSDIEFQATLKMLDNGKKLNLRLSSNSLYCDYSFYRSIIF